MANYGGKNQRAKSINQLIRDNVLPHHSIEAIKGARREDNYKDQVCQTARQPISLMSVSASPASLPQIKELNATTKLNTTTTGKTN
ncbi:hypothetical protein E2C01_060863 [Portunus trituberculatus]|uniref:Uncharacterized protein n=1 Tax=Portunus trituberculatus TaxID=210409 RepID=A0A5B7H2C4_PORTR|nr:hypothetical protein [Portunus trituberculatus]